jgi:hypothetical protein
VFISHLSKTSSCFNLRNNFNRKWKVIAINFKARYSDPKFFYDRIAHRGRFLVGKQKSSSQNQITPRKWTTEEEIWLKNEADRSQSIEHQTKEKHGKKEKNQPKRKEKHGKKEKNQPKRKEKGDWKKISILFEKQFNYKRSPLSIRNKLVKLRHMQGQNSSAVSALQHLQKPQETDMQGQYSSAVSAPQDLQKPQETDKWTTEEELWLIKYNTVWCQRTVHGTRIRLNWHEASILFKIKFGYEHSAQSFYDKLLELQGGNAFTVSAPQELQQSQEVEQPSVSESSLQELQKECCPCATKEHAADSDNCLPADHCFTTVESMRNLGSDLLLEDLYDLGDDPFSGL